MVRHAETRGMIETGEPFDVAAVGDSSERYTLEPVLRYGRTAAGGRLVRATWSSWAYRVRGDSAADARPLGLYGAGERPERFTIDLSDGAESIEVRVVEE